MRLGSTTALPDDPTSLAFGGATPDALLLTDGQCILEARDTHPTSGADLFGIFSFRIIVRKEDARLEASARSQFPPYDLFGRHDTSPV
jgi:hypothetical protein